MDSSAISSEVPPGLEYLIHRQHHAGHVDPCPESSQVREIVSAVPSWASYIRKPCSKPEKQLQQKSPDHKMYRSPQIDHILIHQQFEFVEAILGFETANKYKIQNQLGQKVYYAVEESNFFTRNCCGDYRSFSMRILDNTGHEVILLNRPLRCSSCFCPCCLQKIEVQAPPGVPIGYVIQTWHPCLPTFTVQNEKKQAVLKIAGPCITCSFGGNIDFEITSLDEKIVIGRISKHWSGFLKELLTDVDSFGIQFPLDLDVKMKAVLLGACFLIDFMFFETGRGQRPKL